MELVILTKKEIQNWASQFLTEIENLLKIHCQGTEHEEIIGSKRCRELLGGISQVTLWDYGRKGLIQPYWL